MRIIYYIIFCLLSLGGYLALGYFTGRDETTLLFAEFYGLFSLYILFMLWYSKLPEKGIGIIICLAIVFRLVLVFSYPSLSDDYFRFIWDGRLWSQGINPFHHLPSEIAQTLDPALFPPELYGGLNSPDYYTIYPPVNQGIFYLGALLFPGNIYGHVVFMKVLLLLFECGTLLILYKILKSRSLNPRLLGYYALNPLVIIEITGNLHFEGIMIFFLLLTLYLIRKNKFITSSLTFACAVCVKIVPLIFLFSIIRRFPVKKVVVYVCMVFFIAAAGFMLILDFKAARGIIDSIGLYFGTFEFNASVYYLVREAGYYFTGYNIIGQASRILGIIIFAAILGFNVVERNISAGNLPKNWMWSLFIFLLLSTTVHPWYILLLIPLGILSGYYFPVVWSGLIFLSYSAYGSIPFKEELWLVAMEYLLLLTCVIFERRNVKIGR